MKRYDPYRGRGGARTFLKVLIVILLIVLILAILGFFLLDRGLVVSSDGLRLEFPFTQREKEGETPAPAPAEPSGSLSLIVESPTGAPNADPSEGAEALHAVLLPRTALYDGTAAEQVSAAGGAAALFDMKADDGSLGYTSQLTLARSSGVSDDNAALNAAIRGLNTGELYTVARVACFRDNTIPYHNNGTALRFSGGNWRDTGGSRWLNVGRQSARDYVVGVCAELAELGFDEILLDYAGYPVGGSTNRILRNESYQPENLSEAVSGFFEQLDQALEPYSQVRISVVISDALFSEGTDISGQTPELLRQYADRVWVAAPADSSDSVAEWEGLPVVWTGTEPPADAESWAIWQREP